MALKVNKNTNNNNDNHNGEERKNVIEEHVDLRIKIIAIISQLSCVKNYLYELQ